MCHKVTEGNLVIRIIGVAALVAEICTDILVKITESFVAKYHKHHSGHMLCNGSRAENSFLRHRNFRISVLYAVVIGKLHFAVDCRGKSHAHCFHLFVKSVQFGCHCFLTHNIPPKFLFSLGFNNPIIFYQLCPSISTKLSL